MTVAIRICVALAASWVLSAAVTVAADVETITHGRAVELENHLVPGKYVLFDFYADWCGPCRVLEPQLLDLAGRHAERLALRKVDIINWDSEVARQFRMSSIPHLILYGPDGARLAAGDPGSVLHSLRSALGDGRGRTAASDSTSPVAGFIAIATIGAIALAVVIRRRRSAESRPSTLPSPVDTAADPSDPAIWFAVLQGSLEGPFTRGQLTQMVRSNALGHDSKVRRRGDADWSDLEDVLD